MRETYFDLPAGSLGTARSVLLDSNISSRVENLHRRQEAGKELNSNTPEMTKLRNLASSIPAGAVLITGLSALEAQLRRTPREIDEVGYNRRADAASFYLSEGREYLLALLEGKAGGGLVIESAPAPASLGTLEPMRRWLTVSYCALLKAVEIHFNDRASPAEQVDDFRFFLEHELRASPSREAWVGFLLLGGMPESQARARRLLKVGSRGDLLDFVWGATWDLWYTRMPTMVQLSVFKSRVKSPLVFVTDDEALVHVTAGLQGSFAVRNAMDAEFGVERPDLGLLMQDVRTAVSQYMERDGRRVALKSRGISRSTVSRAQFLARQIEKSLSSRDTQVTPEA